MGDPQTLSSITSRAQSDLSSRVDAATPGLRRSLFRAITVAFSGAIKGLYDYVDRLAVQCNPATATQIWLERWASIWLGSNPRKQATYSVGSVTVSGTVGASIPDATALQSGLGVEYLTQGDAVIGDDGTVSVSILAIDTGSAGNQAAGEVLSFASPLLGVSGDATVDAGEIGGGADVETDDSLRSRMLQRIQNPPHGGNAADYVAWATSVAPITRAWCFPTYGGAGTVRVYVANDDYVGDNLASPADVTAADTYMQGVRPLGVVVDDGEGGVVSGLTVLAPIKQPVDITLSDSPDNSDIRAAITARLQALFAAEAAPEGTIPIHHISGEIYNAAGLYDFTMTTPTVDQVADAGKILSLGTITWE